MGERRGEVDLRSHTVGSAGASADRNAPGGEFVDSSGVIDLAALGHRLGDDLKDAPAEIKILAVNAVANLIDGLSLPVHSPQEPCCENLQDRRSSHLEPNE